MRWWQLGLDYVHALVWPGVVTFFLWRYKQVITEQLPSLLGRVTKGSALGVTLEFEAAQTAQAGREVVADASAAATGDAEHATHDEPSALPPSPSWLALERHNLSRHMLPAPASLGAGPFQASSVPYVDAAWRGVLESVAMVWQSVMPNDDPIGQRPVVEAVTALVANTGQAAGRLSQLVTYTATLESLYARFRSLGDAVTPDGAAFFADACASVREALALVGVAVDMARAGHSPAT